MFVYCRECEWSQDDFWDEGYNPFKFMYENYTEDLLTKDLDEIVEMDSFWLKENGYDQETFTRRKYLEHELQRKINTINNMVYPTHEDYKKRNPEGICPECGEQALVMD